MQFTNKDRNFFPFVNITVSFVLLCSGNIFAFGLFVSPMWVLLIHLFVVCIKQSFSLSMDLTVFSSFRPTFRRIMRNKSTEQFSGLPYIYALLNCLICLWYGTPFISHSNAMLMTVNSVGATFQLCYIILFIMHTDKKNKVFGLFLLLTHTNKLLFFFLTLNQHFDHGRWRCLVCFLWCLLWLEWL